MNDLLRVSVSPRRPVKIFFLTEIRAKTRTRLFGAATAWVCVLLLLGCSGDPGKGPLEVKWDRDACERCRMVLSDRAYAAQVRFFPEESRSKVFKFDDIGCAVLWLEDKPWSRDPKTEIWVRDRLSDQWIDARTAVYIKGRVTPMEYGLGAQSQADPNGMDFAQARSHIAEVEQRFNVHGVELLDRLRKQAAEREALNQAPKMEGKSN